MNEGIFCLYSTLDKIILHCFNKIFLRSDFFSPMNILDVNLTTIKGKNNDNTEITADYLLKNGCRK